MKRTRKPLRERARELEQELGKLLDRLFGRPALTPVPIDRPRRRRTRGKL